MSALPRVDPATPKTAFERFAHRVSNTAIGRWVGIHLAARVDPFLLKLTGGRFAITAYFPLTRLVVRGRRSGIERITPLVYFTEADEVILIASSFGREGHPAWYLNARAAGEVSLLHAGRPIPHRVREAEGEERDRLFAKAVQLYAGYGSYAELTDGVREIPVLALSPI